MDLLKDAAKNLNLYEVKAYVRKAQNVAMNLTEMESKVREATNNEPWGAPSTLMAQIASGTYNYREREEIVAFIFRRFTEKAANEWRQIYKSLQLLDYLIKNGSERIIDDNLIAFLNDDNLIRSERKKARANAKKFGGVSSAAYGGASSMGTGFGSGGSTFTASAYNNGATGNDNFEEYDVQASHLKQHQNLHSSSRINAKASKKEPQNDLLGDLLSFDGDGQQTSTNTATASRGTGANDDDDDDDFDDFQAAPSQPQKPANLSNNLNNLYNPSSQQQNQAVSGPNYNVNYQASQSTGPAKTTSNNDAFSSLFSSAKTKSKTSTGNTSTSSSTTTPAAAAAASVNASNPTSSANDDFFGGFSSNNNSSSNNTKLNQLPMEMGQTILIVVTLIY
ncbi:ENTH domain family protein [Candida albicans]|uniref:ENTH domain family protein n=1 Tax=Candida albicans TaxID=5476 RepID=A0A8H6BXB1_CANAX|nr:ENTH domain family protein [Candida albicans]